MGHVALVARLGAGGCAHDGLGGGHGCHLLMYLAQLIAHGGHVISNNDGLGAHGTALSVNGVLAPHAVILLKHGEDLEARLVKVVGPLALVDLAGVVHANDVRQGCGQQVVVPVVCRPFEFKVELEELLHPCVRCSLGARRYALLNQGLALVGSLGDARVIVLDLVQVLNVHPSPMHVIVVVATQPVLEGGVSNADHEDGKGILVASLDELLYARLLVSSSHLLVVELLGMLTSYSRIELVVEEDDVQLVLVEVQYVLEIALEFEELGPALMLPDGVVVVRAVVARCQLLWYTSK
eukprot:6201216-Pleurochrysis_carterae.AAC.3